MDAFILENYGIDLKELVSCGHTDDERIVAAFEHGIWPSEYAWEIAAEVPLNDTGALDYCPSFHRR